ncbi:MAG: DUF3971 domain-containing protein, partial [Pseudomonadota bacterium]
MTKTFIRITLTLFTIYIVIWVGVALYVNNIVNDPSKLEAFIASFYEGRQVEVADSSLDWSGFVPEIQIMGLHVEGDTSDNPAFGFEQLLVQLDAFSFLRLWPQVNGLAIESPIVEISASEGTGLRIAGLRLGGDGTRSKPDKRLASWLLDQKNASVHNAVVVWRRINGEVQVYDELNGVYDRERQARHFDMSGHTPKGALALSLETRGNIVAHQSWDADIEVLGGGEEPLLGKDDLSLVVSDGVGQLQVKTLDIQRIMDLLNLSGVTDQFPSLAGTALDGRLKDLMVTFSGPLLDLETWNLRGSLQDIALIPQVANHDLPQINNINGKIIAAAEGGELEIILDQSALEWERRFEQPILIDQFSGLLTWRKDSDGDLKVNLVDASYQDAHISVSQINAQTSIERSDREIDNFAELFTLESVGELEFESGEMVRRSGSQTKQPFSVQADGLFSIKDVGALDLYIPKTRATSKLIDWWSNAFLQGSVDNGSFSFAGPASLKALNDDAATLKVVGDFANVELDYGFQRDWPVLRQSHGKISLDNNLLTIDAKRAFLEDDEVTESDVKIHDLLKSERRLELTGKTTTSFANATKLVIAGPLMKPEDRPSELPIKVKDGEVDIDIDLAIPLNRVSQAVVVGSALVRNGSFLLPGGVPVEDLNTRIDFTESTASSPETEVSLLGGRSKIRLETLQPAKPPVLRLLTEGDLDTKALQPWVGEHLLTLLSGTTKYQGEVTIDAPEIKVDMASNLDGVAINAPRPLNKPAAQNLAMNLAMRLSTTGGSQSVDMSLGDTARLQLHQNSASKGSFFDKGVLSIGHQREMDLSAGLLFDIETARLDLDAWLETIIDLASYEPQTPIDNTVFLDSMRQVRIKSDNPLLLGRQFGELEIITESTDGQYWFGSIVGDRVNGNMQLEPRTLTGLYRFDLANLHLDDAPDQVEDLLPIDESLSPSSYPSIEVTVENFKYVDTALGRFALRGGPTDTQWHLDQFSFTQDGVETTGDGVWDNSRTTASKTTLNFKTQIEQAGDAMDSMAFDGILRSGRGWGSGMLTWQGAPHEFDYSRLNGDFKLKLKDGELVQ